jgi:hypothetical protein
MNQLSVLAPQGSFPQTPTTALNDAFPLLAGVLDIPMIVMLYVAMFGIPLLVVAGLSERWTLRAAMAAVLVVLAGGTVWAMAPTGEVRPWSVAFGIARVVVVFVSLAVWGSLAAWSWLVAALAVLGLSGMRLAAYGVVWQERGAGFLTLVVGAALIALIARGVGRPGTQAENLTHN